MKYNVSVMKRFTIFISLLFLTSCASKYKRMNDIHDGIFIGFIENTSRKIMLEVTKINDLNEYEQANGLNVISDVPVYGHFKIMMFELMSDNTTGEQYNFYNLKQADGSKDDKYFWYIDDNKTTFIPVTSDIHIHDTIYYDAYYLIDYYNCNSEFQFSVKLYTEEKFNNLYPDELTKNSYTSVNI